MRKLRLDRIFPATLVLPVLFLLTACASSTPTTRTKPVAKVPVAQPVNDAFANFGGRNVEVGKKFRMTHNPMGIQSLRVVLKLKRTDWTIFEDGEGKEVKEGTANIRVYRGGKSVLVRMGENDIKKVLGITLHLHKAGESYNKARADWFPFVILKVN